MLATQACPNSRRIESEQGDENGFDVPVLSSDESSLSETSLDDACDAFFDHKALEAGTLAKRPPEQLGDRRALPLESLGNVICIVRVPRAGNEGTEVWPNGKGDIQHNTSPTRLRHTTGEFEGVVGGIVGRRFVEVDAKMFANNCQGRPPGGHRAHVGTVQRAKAGGA